GNVGIGTTNPGQTLEVNGTIQTMTAVLNVGSYTALATTSAKIDFFTDAQGVYKNWEISSNGTVGGALSITPSVSISGNTFTTPAITILQGGNVGIGNTAPNQKLEVSGTIRQTGCLTAGTISVNASGDIICTPSSIKFKNDRVELMDGLQTLIQLNPVSYKFNSDMNLGSDTHFGFISEEVNAVLPEFATHDASGKPYGLDSTAILAVTVNAVKELNLNLNSIAGKEISSPTPESESFTKAFFDNVFAKVNTWLASTTNGIGDIFAKRVNTDTLCVSDATGAKTCINKGQLDAFMASVGGASSGTITGGGSSTPPVVEKTPTELLADANAKLTAVVIENYTTESAASFATAKDAALLLPETDDTEKLAKVNAIDTALALLVLKPVVVVPVCTATQTLVNNVCVENAPVVPTCTDTQTLVDNVCVDPAPAP
ncbi:MAG: tail fiber domain-containing protein, partial [Candidatus Paceibacterota bacterium]